MSILLLSLLDSDIIEHYAVDSRRFRSKGGGERRSKTNLSEWVNIRQFFRSQHSLRIPLVGFYCIISSISASALVRTSSTIGNENSAESRSALSSVRDCPKVGQGRLTLIREFKLSVRAIVSCYASRKGGNKRNETNLFQ